MSSQALTSADKFIWFTLFTIVINWNYCLLLIESYITHLDINFGLPTEMEYDTFVFNVRNPNAYPWANNKNSRYSATVHRYLYLMSWEGAASDIFSLGLGTLQCDFPHLHFCLLIEPKVTRILAEDRDATERCKIPTRPVPVSIFNSYNSVVMVLKILATSCLNSFILLIN